MTAAQAYYLLACLECGDPEHPLIMPFTSPAERGKWAAEHTQGTGHERWWVKDDLPAMSRTSMFLEAKKCIRLHPDWDDEKVAEACGIKPVERDLVVTARRDHEADDLPGHAQRS